MTDPIQLPIHNITTQSQQTLQDILLDLLPPNEELLSPKPSRELIEDIGIRGQQTPIQVTVNADGKYIVISGRRRIKALRRLADADPLAIKTVKAIVVTDIGPTTILNMASVENNLRNDNPLTDLQAIVNLKSTNPGISEAEISRQTGIPIARVKKRLKLNNLISPLFTEMVNGKINITVAENIAKLGADKQNNLVNTFIAHGKITSEDVVEVQRAVVKASASTLPAFPDMPIQVEDDNIVGYVVLFENGHLGDMIAPSQLKNALSHIQDNPEVRYICKLVKI